MGKRCKILEEARLTDEKKTENEKERERKKKDKI